MRAVVFYDVGDIRIEEVPDPRIQDSTDSIVRITASAICGTDLHMVRGTKSGMKPGTILAQAQEAGIIDFNAEDPVEMIRHLTGGIALIAPLMR